MLISTEGGGHTLARITSVEFWPTVNLREYDIELVETVLWVMAGGIVEEGGRASCANDRGASPPRTAVP